MGPAPAGVLQAGPGATTQAFRASKQICPLAGEVRAILVFGLARHGMARHGNGMDHVSQMIQNSHGLCRLQ